MNNTYLFVNSTSGLNNSKVIDFAASYPNVIYGSVLGLIAFSIPFIAFIFHKTKPLTVSNDTPADTQTFLHQLSLFYMETDFQPNSHNIPWEGMPNIGDSLDLNEEVAEIEEEETPNNPGVSEPHLQQIPDLKVLAMNAVFDDFIPNN